MGECINLRRGGKAKVVPTLNANYPANVTLEYKGSTTLKVEIATHGYPEEYTYQWYKGGTAISGATSATYTASSITATSTYYCKVTNKAGTVQSRTATITVKTSPTYTYSGTHQFIDDGSGNWRIKLKSSGDLKFTDRGTAVNGIDVFLVGGGGGGYNNGWGGGGGGGGYTKTVKAVSVSKNTNYSVTIGGGGSVNGRGGTTTAFSNSAEGGHPPYKTGDLTEYKGGNGGSGGGGFYVDGGSDGSDGKSWTNGKYVGGKGQGTTTKEFGTGDLYGGGGGGGSDSSTVGVTTYGGAGGGGNSGYKKNASKGTDNLGGGGGGACSGSYSAAGGGSGIVVIRNKR